MAMRIVERAADLHALLRESGYAGRRIGFVPTMGNLHDGHYSLIDVAREHADLVVASVFVNPTQFGPHEDFARYPRTPESDIAGLDACACDVVFLPTVQDMYPSGVQDAVRVVVPTFGDILEGAIRPGHFDGVAGVVTRLFNVVRPDVAVFGQKDYQQLLVIQHLTHDLGFPIEIVGAPIVRETNGLAMSSRNQYLSAQQREQAAVIQHVLQGICKQVCTGNHAFSSIETRAQAQLEQAGLIPDYAVVRRADDLRKPVEGDNARLIGLIAARLGSTRLIDNLMLEAGNEQGPG